MANPGYSDEQLIDALQKLAKWGGVVAHAARQENLPESTFRHQINTARNAARAGRFGTDPVIPGFEITKVSTTEDVDGNVKSRAIQQKPETDKAPFNMPDGHALKGVSALVDENGIVKQQWFKTDRKAEIALSVIEAAKEAMSELTATSPLIDPPKLVDSDYVSVIPLVDWHIGLMAWAEETGENYDLKIAENVIMDAMQRVMALTPNSKECVILGLGDMLHSDGFDPVTSRSKNILDVDGRWPKVLKTAIRMIRATIDLALQKHEIVHVRILPGNHDDESAVAISTALSLFYENQERVHFDDGVSRYWWKRFGKVFMGATHGDKTKMKDLPLVMACDNPHDWAASTYKRVWTGHIHHESKIEEGGVIVTSMRSPVAKDAYHSFSKYRSGRSVYTETFNINGSMAGTTQINI
ncbi:hypothetical protein [Maritalea porphyrae]|uniref:hypothetical protein n=1 Tax=Maritalea porphyrae TaxID=880732 RepID=UPI0022AF1713|nr:hypothetical protein [Maritalea porphyrae]MCZ4270872.1 hypothetical protein [Maritalea porphyrae]